LTRDAVVVVPYDPGWPAQFEAERAGLEEALALWLEGGVHHVGSTAVPGLAAKPILDMLAGVGGLDAARAASAPLAGLGYVSAPHRPDEAHHFSKPSARLAEATHGLHLTVPGSDLWRERLAFRDALRADPALVREYAGLKARLARDHGCDLGAYTAGKRAFVASVLARAGLSLQPRV
jgi:GrpB-like predicted nucleotidyltransferase (UPF0157 family)